MYRSVASLINTAPLHAAVGPSQEFVVPLPAAATPTSSSLAGITRPTRHSPVVSPSSSTSAPPVHVQVTVQSPLAINGVKTLEQIVERDRLKELADINQKLSRSQRVFLDENLSLPERVRCVSRGLTFYRTRELSPNIVCMFAIGHTHHHPNRFSPCGLTRAACFAVSRFSFPTQIPAPIQPPSRFPRKSFVADNFFSGGSSAIRSEHGHTYYKLQRPLQGRLQTFYPNATTAAGYPFHMFAF
jgi:hypothetical protein